MHGRLPVQLQAELHLPRRIPLARDQTDIVAAEVGVRLTPDHAVERGTPTDGNNQRRKNSWSHAPYRFLRELHANLFPTFISRLHVSVERIAFCCKRSDKMRRARNARESATEIIRV
jgi:hypothetical protein